MTSVAAAALLLATAAMAHGQTAQSLEGLRTRGLLAVGDTVSVEDASGKGVRGRVESLGTDSLTLVSDTARRRLEYVFSEADISRIERAGGHAKVVSALVGAGAGLLAAGAAAAAYGENEGGRFCSGCFVRWSTAAVPIGAGIGALIGWGIDQANVRTVYLAPGTGPSVSLLPVVSRRTFGGVAVLRF